MKSAASSRAVFDAEALAEALAASRNAPGGGAAARSTVDMTPAPLVAQCGRYRSARSRLRVRRAEEASNGSPQNRAGAGGAGARVRQRQPFSIPPRRARVRADADDEPVPGRGDEKLRDVREEPRVHVRRTRVDDGGGVHFDRRRQQRVELRGRARASPRDARGEKRRVLAVRRAQRRVLPQRGRDEELEPSRAIARAVELDVVAGENRERGSRALGGALIDARVEEVVGREHVADLPKPPFAEREKLRHGRRRRRRRRRSRSRRAAAVFAVVAAVRVVVAPSASQPRRRPQQRDQRLHHLRLRFHRDLPHPPRLPRAVQVKQIDRGVVPPDGDERREALPVPRRRLRAPSLAGGVSDRADELAQALRQRPRPQPQARRVALEPRDERGRRDAGAAAGLEEVDRDEVPDGSLEDRDARAGVRRVGGGVGGGGEDAADVARERRRRGDGRRRGGVGVAVVARAGGGRRRRRRGGGGARQAPAKQFKFWERLARDGLVHADDAAPGERGREG
eukprot:31477-Pelagococcus_subviridis.AAC.18